MKNVLVHIRNPQFLTKCLSVAFLFVLLSCDGNIPEDASVNEKAFYDVKGFIECQIVVLEKERPEVSKKVSMGNEHNALQTKDMDWEKELGLFIQADINKPAFKQSYSVSRPDSSTYVYVSKEGDRLAVRNLKIVVDSTGVPAQIEALIKSENKLYVSEKHIFMKAKNNRIQQYRISGYQQLIMMDRKPFSVDAVILN
jgi:hypothetical protein